MHKIITSIFLAPALCPSGIAQAAEPKPLVLITNANVFDGQNEKLADGMSVLVEGNKIAKIAQSISAPSGATVINAQGRVLMPGLTDCGFLLSESISCTTRRALKKPSSISRCPASRISRPCGDSRGSAAPPRVD